MPADASIYGGLRPQQAPNRLAELAQALQVRDLQDQGELRQYTMRKAQREDEDVTALNAAYSQALDPATGQVDRNKLFSIVAQGGRGSKLPGIQKQFADADNAAADVGKKKADTLKEFLGAGKAAMGRVFAMPSLESANAALDEMEQHARMLGLPTASIGQQRQMLAGFTSADQIKQWAAGQAMAADKLLPTIQTRNTGATTDTLAIDPLSGVGKVTGSVRNTMSPGEAARLEEQRRHHGVTEGNQAATLTKPFEITGPDGNPVLVQMDKTGKLRPVEGFGPKQGASRPLTEGQAKANLFGTRMKEADRILNDLEDSGVKDPGVVKSTVQGIAGLTPFMGDKLSEAAGSAMNVVPGILGGPNEDQQRVEQARRDFINAVLRKESGAVISPQEFANADRQYFPQPGEGKKVRDQKREARRRATELMLAEVPGNPRGGSASAGRSAEGKVVDFGSLK
jgi:hypothetical protein